MIWVAAHTELLHTVEVVNVWAGMELSPAYSVPIFMFQVEEARLRGGERIVKVPGGQGFWVRELRYMSNLSDPGPGDLLWEVRVPGKGD